MLIRYNNLYYLTCTCHKWKPLLVSCERKSIIMNCFNHLFHKGQMKIFAFVILDNHFHILYECAHHSSPSKLKHSLLSFTSKMILQTLTEKEKDSLIVNHQKKYRQVWKAHSLNVTIYSEKFRLQKFHYIHKNVARAGLDERGYGYSSLPSYLSGVSEYDFLTLW